MSDEGWVMKGEWQGVSDEVWATRAEDEGWVMRGEPWGSVVDPERFDADPDPTFQADADPDPNPFWEFFLKSSFIVSKVFQNLSCVIS